MSKYIETLIRHRWRLSASWVLCLCLLSPCWGEQSYFEGALRLPTLKNFELFQQTVAAAKGGKYSFQRWDLQTKKGAKPVAYLLANPAEKLWVTLRKASSSARISGNSPIKLKEFDKNFVTQLKSHSLKATTTQYGKSAAGSAVVYQFRNGLAKGYHGYLVCLTPTVDNFPKDAYVITIVCTDKSQAKAIKLVETLLKGTWIAPS